MATTGMKQQEPMHVRLYKWLFRGDTGAVLPEIDTLASEAGGRAINAAHSTDYTPIAAAVITTGKRLMLKNINIDNREAYNVRVDVYDGPSASALFIDSFTVGATSTFGITELTGYIFATSVVFQTIGTGGEAFSAGTSVRVGGILINT